MKRIILILALLFTAGYAETTQCKNAKNLVNVNAEILKATQSKADYTIFRSSIITGGETCNMSKNFVDRLLKQLDVTVGKNLKG